MSCKSVDDRPVPFFGGFVCKRRTQRRSRLLPRPARIQPLGSHCQKAACFLNFTRQPGGNIRHGKGAPDVRVRNPGIEVRIDPEFFGNRKGLKVAVKPFHRGQRLLDAVAVAGHSGEPTGDFSGHLQAHLLKQVWNVPQDFPGPAQKSRNRLDSKVPLFFAGFQRLGQTYG